MAKKEEGLSAVVVVVLVLGIATYLCWGVLAASYIGGTTDENYREAEKLAESREKMERMSARRVRASSLKAAVAGIAKFVKNSITQLPQLPQVIVWHVTNRLWLLIGLGVVEAGLVGGGLAMVQMEQNSHKKPKVRKRTIVVPQGD